ncbi:hypothetical protein HO173_001149 [Letharia columbiana]|uniref:Peptidase S8/S53 domain-containing protein n=1 Tax=Letharia columbiana TaxID=112416 RepID=A0A8H6G4Q1_9LECA|nr:uncharacterized protein HO173_001149 [Letharia columbiana]KAF6240481.1 hypothetical protein HO173_001149 [Letharia columbiana]
MSFGFLRWYHSIEKAIDRAASENIIVFASASNSGANRKIAFPASYPRVICINSADGSGARSRYNFPPSLQVTTSPFSEKPVPRPGQQGLERAPRSVGGSWRNSSS